MLNNRTLMVIGGLGCVSLMCAAFIILIGMYYIMQDSIDDAIADFLPRRESTAMVQSPPIIPTPTSTLGPATPTITPTATLPATATPTLSPTAAAEPSIGALTFALGATEDYQPINPAVTFEEGITQVHAIFEYSGMSREYTWERVWYLDDLEILRSNTPGTPKERWSGAEVGVFDYFINNGGDPLPVGKWVLEIYVEDKLQATGDFTITWRRLTPTPVDDDRSVPTVEIAATAVAPEPTPASLTVPAATPTPVPAAGLSSNVYQLAYTKWDGGKHNLYIADTNGAGERFIIGRAAGPSWSPDGRTLFFYGEEGIDRQVIAGTEYLFDGISNGIVALSAVPLPNNINEVDLYQGLEWKQGTARASTVSPNGDMVAFDATFSGNSRIYFLGTDANEQYQFEIQGEQPAWSPDSQQVVFRSGRNGKTGLWISNRNDTGHILLTDGSTDSFPEWSADGETVLFSRDEEGNVDIYSISIDGTNLQRLTTSPAVDTLPVYTPDGDIVFRSSRNGVWGIWKMTATGDEQTLIIQPAPVGPDWAYSRMDVN